MINLKVALTSFILFFGYYQTVRAQTFILENTQISFDSKLRPALAANIEPEAKSFKKAWAHYLKKTHQVKLKGIGFLVNRDLLSAKDVIVAAVSSKRMNIYTRIMETSDGSEVKLFASFGYDIFIGPENYPNEYASMQAILNTFLIENLQNYYNNEIKETSKRITGLQKEKVRILKAIRSNTVIIEKSLEDLEKINAKGHADNQDAIKLLDKANKVNTIKTKCENENTVYLTKVTQIDAKLVNRKVKLEKLKLKYKNLNTTN